ncbi:DUF1563 domain-containing protein, partial [Leptospira interrogans]
MNIILIDFFLLETLENL